MDNSSHNEAGELIYFDKKIKQRIGWIDGFDIRMSE